MRSWSVKSGFAISLISLGLIAFAEYRTSSRFAASEGWISHTRDVESVLARLRSDVAVSDSARLESLVTGDRQALVRYRETSARVPGLLARLQELTADNQRQQQSLQQLVPVVNRRMELMARSVADHSGKPLIEAPLDRALFLEEAAAAADMSGIVQNMLSEEEELLGSRRQLSRENYLNLQTVIAAGLFVVLALLIFSFRNLMKQLSERERAEQSVRRLSAQILHVQDGERRRLARELHDSVGQLFAGLGMQLQVLTLSPTIGPREREILEECQRLVADGSSQTRTISHLLHPPMLDELGFAQAAKWYVNGFRERSGIDTTITLSEPFERLADGVELALFRVLQESLTNAHRHSGSKRVEVSVHMHTDRVSITVRDYGKGIPRGLQDGVAGKHSGSGIGLGGMRERLADLGGHLVLESDHTGTTVRVTVPLVARGKEEDRSGRTAPASAGETGQRNAPDAPGATGLTLSSML